MVCKFDIKKVGLVVAIIVAVAVLYMVSVGALTVSESFHVNDHAEFKGEVKTCDKITKAVEEGNKVVVAFHGTWCGHCKAMKPQWDKFYTAWDGKIVDGKTLKVFAIESASERALKEFNRRFGFSGVNGFPTIVQVCKKGSKNYTFKEFNGERTVPGFVGFSRS